MSERKVLNKYYPPDFDPSKIPRARLGKNRQFTVRLMAPCNMRCDTCGEYIYKGKKFNARKEDVENQDYLGIRIYRFYIKCTRCLQEISFKTDPVSTDYIIEAGATRNFMALKLAEEQAAREEAAEKEDEATNPMKLLEKRTEASKNEMASLEALEELKELNQRKINLDYKSMLNKYDNIRDAEIQKDQDEEDRIIQELLHNQNGTVIRRINDESSDSDDGQGPPPPKKFVSAGNKKPTDFLTAPSAIQSQPEVKIQEEKSVGMLSVKNKKSLVLVKPRNAPASSSTPSTNNAAKVTAAAGTMNEGGGGLGLLGAYSSSDDSN